MAKFYGPVGFSLSQETSPGVWEEIPVEKNFYGDILKNTVKGNENPGKVNGDITVNNRISIVANPYAAQHFHQIEYVIWQGVKWKVESVDVEMPRLILNLGGIYVE